FAAGFAASGLPGKPTVFLTNGGCGNINPAVMAGDYSGVERAGTALGNAVINAISDLKPCRKDGIESRFSEFELPLEMLSSAQLKEIRDGYDSYCINHGDCYGTSRLRMAMDNWYEETKNLLANGQAPRSITAYIHVLRIGPVVFAGVNAEVFSKMAGRLRQATGIELLYVVGYTDGCIGYLAPREIYGEGGYEVNEAYKYYGYFSLAPGGFELVRDKIQTMLCQEKVKSS
ncbi:MAG: hypothetical protein PHV82_16910, partial [Victivallaceae bacterium]|nr:hypothetical protein [Victivallaceae bacterium]